MSEPQGSQGVRGLSGPTGLRGERPQGERGATGPAGPEGAGPGLKSDTKLCAAVATAPAITSPRTSSEPVDRINSFSLHGKSFTRQQRNFTAGQCAFAEDCHGTLTWLAYYYCCENPTLLKLGQPKQGRKRFSNELCRTSASAGSLANLDRRFIQSACNYIYKCIKISCR